MEETSNYKDKIHLLQSKQELKIALLKLKTSLKDGDLVLIKGRINVYEARGTYSINASEVIFDGLELHKISVIQIVHC